MKTFEPLVLRSSNEVFRELNARIGSAMREKWLASLLKARVDEAMNAPMKSNTTRATKHHKQRVDSRSAPSQMCNRL